MHSKVASKPLNELPCAAAKDQGGYDPENWEGRVTRQMSPLTNM